LVLAQASKAKANIHQPFNIRHPHLSSPIPDLIEYIFIIHYSLNRTNRIDLYRVELDPTE